MEGVRPQHVSKEHEKFMKEFIQLYKENQLLWDKSHPKYKSRVARNAAFDVIINKCQEYYPEANIDFVKHKIESMRTAFRREHKKVLESKKRATEEDNYVPTLWYYNHFLFIVGEECNDNLEPNEANSRNIYFWSKKHTVSLIELLKKYPILHTMDAGSTTAKAPRIKAYDELTKDLIAETGKHFDVEEVRKKISSLKGQYRRECKNKTNGGTHTLWCYELLTFLKDYRIKKGVEKNDDDNDNSDDSRDNVLIKDDDYVDIDSKDEKMLMDESYDDIYDTIGKNVANKLRDMSDDQRKYAEDLVNQVMYNGLMDNLNADSSLTLSTI